MTMAQKYTSFAILASAMYSQKYRNSFGQHGCPKDKNQGWFLSNPWQSAGTI